MGCGRTVMRLRGEKERGMKRRMKTNVKRMLVLTLALALAAAPAAMGLQVFWAAALMGAGYALTKTGLRRAVILGG